jgi:hypothetical protein
VTSCPLVPLEKDSVIVKKLEKSNSSWGLSLGQGIPTVGSSHGPRVYIGGRVTGGLQG